MDLTPLQRYMQQFLHLTDPLETHEDQSLRNLPSHTDQDSTALFLPILDAPLELHQVLLLEPNIP